MFTLGSLFAGIGGIDLGFEATGKFKTKWQVEIDEHASKVLRKHWPSVARWKNVKTFPPRPIKDWQVDVIAGGFPCQDLSFAGRGAGLEGERSGLFHEIIRVARIIRPRAIVLENVAALYVRGLDVVLGELAQIGYDAEWHCISASSVGAPHKRDRVFIIAWDTNGEYDDSIREVQERSATKSSRSGANLRDANGDSKPAGSVHAEAPELQGNLANASSSGNWGEPGNASGQRRESTDARQPTVVRQGNGQIETDGIEPGGKAEPNPTEAVGNAPSIGVQRFGAGWLKIAQAHAGEKLPVRPSVEFSDANGERLQGGTTKHENATHAGELRGSSGEWHYWDFEPDVGRVAYGVPGRSHRLKGLGNAVVPQCAQVIATRLLEIIE